MNNQNLTGFPSIDKPWMKYYSEEALNATVPDCSMFSYFYSLNKSKPDDIALKYFQAKYTYGEVFSMIEQTAGAFISIGVKKGDIVTIALPNIPENIFCIYALNKIGAVANLIDLRAKGEILANYLTEVKSKNAVVCTLFLANALEIINQTAVKKLIVVSPVESLASPVRALYELKNKAKMKDWHIISWRKFLSNSVSIPTVQMSGNDTACIFHTSGTTGLPKGVMLPNKCFNAIPLNYRYCGIDFKENDIFLNQVPPFLAYNSVVSTNMPLCFHMCIILLPTYEPTKFAYHITKLKPNHVAAGPADWESFLHYKLAKDYSFLKCLGSGSDSINVKTKCKINDLLSEKGCKYKIMEGYGMTEVGSAAVTNTPRFDILGSMGLPLPLTSVGIFDSMTNYELQYGERGEICICGETVMNGYYNMPEATAEVLRLHEDGKLWMHTGDLGYITEDGCLYLEGRIKRIIIRFDGFKVSPFDIEKTILKNDKVRECCCVGKVDSEHNHGQIPVVYVVREKGADVTDKELIEELFLLCKSTLSERYIPKVIILIENMPLTSNGKVDYRALEALAEKEYQS